MERHIYQTGIIGNCGFIAHIHRNTNVEWMCWPRFDSDFIFGKMIAGERGGEFSVLPIGKFTTNPYYKENTNILCNVITGAEGSYLVTDFAPRFIEYDRFFRPLMLVRKIEPLSGTPSVTVVCRPVQHYGTDMLKPLLGSHHLEFHGELGVVRLVTNVGINYIQEGASFVLNETKYLFLTLNATVDGPLEATAETFLYKTTQYWQQWIKNTTISDFYQSQVIRSSLALKIHQFEDTGAIIASSTTSLSEFNQSGRNWDYRYCWLRDTYYILQAFNNIGHFEEMERYFNFITNVSAGAPGRLQPLYGITGQTQITETTLDLPGYLNNQPVRIGNQAYEHIQNDVYGQVLISLLPLYIDRRFNFSERTDSVKWLSGMIDKMERTIHEKDAGLWEYRTVSLHNCYTKLFYWVGSSAAIKIALLLNEKKLISRAVKLKRIATRYIEQCYQKDRKVYVEGLGTQHLDASTLQLILLNYLNPASPKAKIHLKVVEEGLKADGGLFYRYKHADDFGKPSSTFLICAYWYVEALACVGRLDEAVTYFEKTLQYTNHLGLLSEDVDPVDGSQWGNFPQAYSHVGLMNAAYRISKKLDKPIFL